MRADAERGCEAPNEVRDASTQRDGGITQVTTVDHHSKNLIGFGSFCTVVYGS